MVHLGSVPIDSSSGLGAEVAVPGVEIECTDAVFAADTLELYSPIDPIGSVVPHGLIVVLCSEGRTTVGFHTRHPTNSKPLSAGVSMSGNQQIFAHAEMHGGELEKSGKYKHLPLTLSNRFPHFAHFCTFTV